MTEPYRGRFAPSPSGALHFGSLVAATASYLQARHRAGQWLVRIEDIDPPREVPGAADTILRQLDAFGFEWDGDVSYQSQHSDRYVAALEQLQQADWLFACACSRKDIAKLSHTGVYPGTCRQGLPAGRHARSWRVRIDDRVIDFTDRIQGKIRCELASQVGDFVVKRADGLFAYHLAAAVDDVHQGITEVVRGADLLDATPQQIYLMQLLGLERPEYAHHPVVLDRQRQKFSKQHQSTPLDSTNPVPQLWQALRFLGQQPPEALADETKTAFWDWAIKHWHIDRVSRLPGIPIEEIPAAADI